MFTVNIFLEDVIVKNRYFDIDTYTYHLQEDITLHHFYLLCSLVMTFKNIGLVLYSIVLATFLSFLIVPLVILIAHYKPSKYYWIPVYLGFSMEIYILIKTL